MSELNMPINLTCSCGKQLRVADEFAGRQGQCPACGGMLEIPEPDPVVRGAASSVEAAHAVTATPAPAASAEPGSPEYAASPLPPAPAEWLPEEPEVRRPGYKLFSPGSIARVAFLAGPVGAFILLALNFWRMGKRGAAWTTIALGLLTLGVLVVIIIALPESVPSFLIGLPLFLALWIAARALQGDAYEAHQRAGGATASGWVAAGIALMGVVLFLGLWLGSFLVYDLTFYSGLGSKIDFGAGEEVYYATGVTEADARALGAFLRETGFFNGRGPKSVRLARDGDRLVLSVIVQEWVLRDWGVQQEIRTMGQQASQRAFGGRPVVVELCDEYFQVKKKL
jgi:hypothetical protein